MNIPLTPLLLCLSCAVASTTTTAANIALLVGVGEYPKLSEKEQLEGPTHDVAAMRQVLQDQWGFAPDNIQSLVNAQATYKNIQKALNDLKTRSQAGDHVLIYLSGHGTSAQHQINGVAYPLPHHTGGFIPYDYSHDKIPKKGKASEVEKALRNSLIVGKWHLRPLIAELERDRDVTVVIDSCYSQYATRSLATQPNLTRTTRNISLPFMVDLSQIEAEKNRLDDEPTPPYPYQRTVSITASSEDQVAMDISSAYLDQSIDGKPHGVLTDMLLRVLHQPQIADANKDGSVSYAELRSRLAQRVIDYNVGGTQTPYVQPEISEDQHHLNLRSLFGTQTGHAAPIQTSTASTALKVAIRGGNHPDALRALAQLSISPVELAQADWILEPQARGWSLLNRATEPVGQGTLASMVQRLKAEQWLQQLKSSVRSKATLQMATVPEQKGAEFYVGDRFDLTVKNSAPAALVLLNISSIGQINWLYPISDAENTTLSFEQNFVVDGLEAKPPIGLDQVIAMTLPTPVSKKITLKGDQTFDLHSPSIQALTAQIQAAIGQGQDVGINTMTIRTYPPKSH